MTKQLALSALKWGLGPMALAVLAAVVGRTHSEASKIQDAIAQLSEAEREALESAPAQAMANATWAFGSAESVKQMLNFELERLPESKGASRARAFLRLGVLDENPDGQAAVFSQACANDPGLCEQKPLAAAAEREVRRRFVAPGNQLPLMFVDGHGFGAPRR